jgi:hypothetical protein
MRLLAKEPMARPADALAVAAELTAAGRHLGMPTPAPAAAAPMWGPPPAAPPVGRPWTALEVLAMIAALSFLGFAVWYVMIR